MKFMQKAYDSTLNIILNGAINGVPGFMKSAYELAQDYKISYPNDLNKQIASLINNQCKISAISGGLSNIGGIITLPIALPANITSVLYLQLKMIAAIAVLCGYDPRNDRVKTILLLCLFTDSIKDICKKKGIDFTTKMGYQIINKIPGKVLKSINKAIGIKLLTKYGAKGFINLSKIVPVAGAVLAASLDFLSTKKIGDYTRKTFMYSMNSSLVYTN